jgi:hypothetical protein
MNRRPDPLRRHLIGIRIRFAVRLAHELAAGLAHALTTPLTPQPRKR